MRPVDRYNCEETFRRLDDFLDRHLSPEEIRLVQEHLDTCGQCASEYAFEESVLRNVRAKLQRIKAPDDLLSRVRQALERERGGGRPSGSR